MRKLLLGTLAAAACWATPLLAQDADLFGKLDANKDGFVTADEVEGDGKAKIERLLRTSDKDGDKKLSKEEFAAGLKETDQPRAPLGEAGERDRPGAGNPQDRRRLDESFNRTDANSDGKIVKDEMPEPLRDRFGQFLERQGVESADKEQFGRFMAIAMQQGRPGAGRPGEGRPPLFVALDADNDGELSSGEIEAASKALLKLDKNSDGKLTREELGPPGGLGRPGEGRPGEGRPPEGRGRFIPEQLQARLKQADKDSDGKLSKDEVEKAELPPFLKEGFGRLDANSDGSLDTDELQRMVERFWRRPTPSP
jgi:Ca2+-binding EF-hand superfamily protein